jgi:hypothetical protein
MIVCNRMATYCTTHCNISFMNNGVDLLSDGKSE